MQRSLSSPALHLFTSQLQASANQPPSSQDPSSSFSLSPASPPPSAPSPSFSSSSAASLARRPSRRRQSLNTGHHLSDVHEAGSSLSRTRVDQRSSPYLRQHPQLAEPSPLSSLSGIAASPGAGSASPRGHRRFRSTGRGGTGSSTSSGSVDEFGARSFEDTPPLTGSSSTRSLSSFGELDYHHAEGSSNVGLGVTGLDFGVAAGGGRREFDARPLVGMPLEDVLEASAFESSGPEQTYADDQAHQSSSYPSDHYQPGLKSPFAASRSLTVASSNPPYSDHSYNSHPASFHPNPSQTSPYSPAHYSHPYHPQNFDSDSYNPPHPSLSHHAPSYLPHIRTTSLPHSVSSPSFASESSTPHRLRPDISPYASTVSPHDISPHHNLTFSRHTLSSTPSSSSHHLNSAPPEGYAPVRVDVSSLDPSVLVRPRPTAVESSPPSRTPSASLATPVKVSTLKTWGSASTLRASKATPKPVKDKVQTSAASSDESEQESVPQPILLPSELDKARIKAEQEAKMASGQKVKQKLTHEDKVEIIQSHKRDPTLTQQESATKYGVDRSTISKILNGKERWLAPPVVSPLVIKPAAKNDPKAVGGGARFLRTEKETNIWLEEQFRAGNNVGDMQLRDQAVIIHNQAREGHDKDFKASTKWLGQFKKRRAASDMWLQAPVPPGTALPASSAVAAIVPSPLPRARVETTIASPSPRRTGNLLSSLQTTSLPREARPMTGTSSSSSVAASPSSSSASSLLSPPPLESSFSSHETSPHGFDPSLPASSSGATSHQKQTTSVPVSVRSRSQSSPSVASGPPSAGPSAKRPSTGKVSKPRPSSLSRGNSFHALSELRAGGSPLSSRPHSPRSVGHRSATSRSPGLSSSSNSSRSSSSLAGRISQSSAFIMTALEPRPLHLTTTPSTQANEFGMALENKPQIGFDAAYQQYSQAEEMDGAQATYGGEEEEARRRMGQARAFGSFSSNLGDLSLSSRRGSLTQLSPGGQAMQDGSVSDNQAYYSPPFQPNHPHSSAPSAYHHTQNPTYVFPPEPTSYAPYNYHSSPADAAYYAQQQHQPDFHRDPRHLPNQHQQQTNHYQQEYPAPPPLPQHFQYEQQQQQQHLVYPPSAYAPGPPAAVYGHPQQHPDEGYYSPYGGGGEGNEWIASP